MTSMNEFHPSIQKVKMPNLRGESKKIPESVRNNIDTYVKLYKAKYGISPVVTWDGQWYRVGNSPGVNGTRFRQLISQLSY